MCVNSLHYYSSGYSCLVIIVFVLRMSLPTYNNTTRIRRASSAPQLNSNNNNYHSMSINGDPNQNYNHSTGGKSSAFNKNMDKRILLDDFSDEESYDTSSRSACDPKHRPNSTLGYILLTSYMIGWSALWTCLLVVAVPYQIEMMVGDEGKGSALGFVVAVGGFNSVVIPPVAGYVSDRTVTRYGRRKPYIVIGTICCSLLILLLPACKTIGAYATIWFCLQTSSNFGSSAFLGLLPDVVPKEQLGNVSGILAACTAFGQLIGAGLGSGLKHVGVLNVYIGLAFVHIFFMLVTVCTTKEIVNESDNGKPMNDGFGRIDGVTGDDDFDNNFNNNNETCCEKITNFMSDVIRPFKSNDFRWVYITRWLIQMGIYSVQEFIQYFVKDVIYPVEKNHINMTVTTMTSALLCIIVIGGGSCGFICGILSDKYDRRKIFVYFAGFFISIATIMLMFSTSFTACGVAAFVFGVGFGSFAAVDMAMVVEALPSEENAATDMGVWHTSLTLPQMIATPIAGIVLDNVKTNEGAHEGYVAVFGIAVAYFVLGTCLIQKLKNIK